MYMIECIHIVCSLCIFTITAPLNISVMATFDITMIVTVIPKCNRYCHSFLDQYNALYILCIVLFIYLLL